MSSEQQQSQRLWTDERITKEVCLLAKHYRLDSEERFAIEDLCTSIVHHCEAELARLRARIAELEAKVSYYEEPLPTLPMPTWEGGRYTVTTDHRFTDEGICIRCGEDAEEWDAGCVESITNDAADAVAQLATLRAELEAARAGQWEPVEDGRYGRVEVGEKGSELWMEAYDPHGHTWDAGAFLGSDLRLCRYVPQEGSSSESRSTAG